MCRRRLGDQAARVEPRRNTRTAARRGLAPLVAAHTVVEKIDKQTLSVAYFNATESARDRLRTGGGNPAAAGGSISI
jgi:hypothetical protein